MADLGAIGVEPQSAAFLGVQTAHVVKYPPHLVLTGEGTISGDYAPVDGAYRVFGTITEDGVPVSCPVLLYRSTDTNIVYRVVMSGADGSYQFSNVAAGQYLVIARDPDKMWNAVCRDHVTALPM